MRFGELKARRGDFFQSVKNPLENIGSESNSPGKPRSRVPEAALGAPVTPATGGAAVEQARALIKWPRWSCADSEARSRAVHVPSAGK